MKTRTLGRLGMLALALCLITTCLLSGTLAKYTSTTTGTGTVTVAQWSNIQFEDEDKAAATFTFDLSGTKDANANVKSDQIGPGDKGDFKITFGPAEVAYTYDLSITATNLTATAAPIKFYTDSARSTAFTNLTDVAVALANAGTAQTVTVYWAWDSANTNANDTAAGIANGSPTFTVEITAEQTTA